MIFVEDLKCGHCLKKLICVIGNLVIDEHIVFCSQDCKISYIFGSKKVK